MRELTQLAYFTFFKFNKTAVAYSCYIFFHDIVSL
jgi:hypothetical protein